jgi:hypothetical protein
MRAWWHLFRDYQIEGERGCGPNRCRQNAAVLQSGYASR